jgi:hypothetical protein
MFDWLVGRRVKTTDPRAECFRHFFVANLGRPVRSRTIHGDSAKPMIDIETYRAPWNRRVRVLTSVGLCHFLEEQGEWAEIMLLVNDEQAAAELAFSRIVGLLADEPAAFGIGEFYEGAGSFGPIARRHGKVAMVLVPRAFEEQDLAHVDCDGRPGHTFTLVPITAAERDLLTTEGWTVLEERLSGADVSDLRRASVV